MKMKQKKTTIIIVISAIVCVLAAAITIWQLNEYHLELNIAEQTITLEYGVDEMPEITALCKGTILNRKGVPVDTTMKGALDANKLGTYNVTFSAVYKGMEITESRTIKIVDTSAPVIKLVSDPEYYTNPSAKYEEEGYSVVDNYDGDITDQMVSEEKDGKVFYSVSDSSGNTATAERTIVYKDTIAPVITLKKGESISLNKGKDFVDPGFTAEDECDGDLTDSVKVEGEVDGHTYGTYTLTYQVSDSSGNIGKIKRTVKIADITKPTIKLKGSIHSYVKVGTSYSEPGFSASDNIDGDLTSKVKVSGSVDTSKMGINTITYTVSDAFGNKTTATRSVYVYKKQAVANPKDPGDKVVYLTFDDGPSRHTEKLLKTLDKYGVKATFFVTNQFPAYQDMIGKAHRQGHTIALHTLTHKYSEIYASELAYYKDLDAIRKIVEKQTGETPTIVRFPGGTSNTVSRKYCKGIMTSLTKSLSYHGYLYCDWNVSSGDAGGTKTASGVAKNVINGIKKKNVSVVLQHDITSYSVEAVEEILFWGIQNGYTFLPMSETTPMVHFSPQN